MHDSFNALVFPQVDVGIPAVFEHVEFVAQAKIDRAAAELFRRQLGCNLDFSLRDVALDVHMDKNHKNSQ